MRKLIIMIIVVLYICPAISNAQVDLEYPSMTTDKEILFMDIPWGETIESSLSVLKESFPEISIVSYEYYPGKNNHIIAVTASDSFHDYDAVFLPVLYSEYVNTIYCISGNVKNLQDNDAHYSIGMVAGHPIEEAVLKYIVNHDYGLYGAEYTFSLNNSDILSGEMKYADLKEKLISKYGLPYINTIDEKMTSGESCLWFGANGTGACLYYYTYDKVKSDSLYYNKEVLRLNYGTTDCNDIFMNAKAEHEQIENEKIQNALDKIKNDDSGL